MDSIIPYDVDPVEILAQLPPINPGTPCKPGETATNYARVRSSTEARRSREASIQQETKRRKTQEATEAMTYTDTSFPKFHVIEETESEGELAKLDPFAVQKGIQGLIGTAGSVKKLRGGQILVEVLRRGQAESLRKTTSFCNITVSITVHRSLNSRKGVIRCRDFGSMSEEDILKELKPQGVTAVRRISTFRDGKRIPTNTYVIDFMASKLPPSVMAGYLSLKVEPYIPNPLRCFTCQKFGHHSDNCRDKKHKCARCAGPHNINDNICSTGTSPKCVNCAGQHMASSRDCPMWQQEKEIVKIKTENNISFPEARKIFNQSKTTTPDGRSYAQAAASKPSVQKTSLSTQTDLFWPLGQDMPSRTPPPVQKPSTAKSTTKTSSTTTTTDFPEVLVHPAPKSPPKKQQKTNQPKEPQPQNPNPQPKPQNQEPPKKTNKNPPKLGPKTFKEKQGAGNLKSKLTREEIVTQNRFNVFHQDQEEEEEEEELVSLQASDNNLGDSETEDTQEMEVGPTDSPPP